MHRRSFLAGAVGGLAAATAGCSGLVRGPVDLDPGDSQLDNDGRKKYLPFEHDGRVRAGVAFDQREVPTSSTAPFGVRINVTHHGQGDDGQRYPDSTIDRFRFDVRPEPNGGVFVTTTTLSDWAVTVRRVEGGWRRIAADLDDEQGDSTLIVPTRIVPIGEPLESIAVNLSVELSDGGVAGTTYRLEADTHFDPVVGG